MVFVFLNHDKRTLQYHWRDEWHFRSMVSIWHTFTLRFTTTNGSFKSWTAKRFRMMAIG